MYIQGVAVTLIVAAVLVAANRVSRQIEDHSDSESRAPLRPMIFPCRTTHTRLFPRSHSLSYSYLLAGVPIGWRGSSGRILSSECKGASTWFSVHQEDYLARTLHPRGLQGKLEEYLSTQGVQPSSIAGAYLATAPRFLGFSFNPVSFWYLYDHDMLLKYMILEVNNTFDERRIYFLQRDSGRSTDEFKQDWKKDFHVSPFNDREGYYSLTAVDPFAFPEAVGLDNNIVLKDADGKPKLVARVFSTENGIDASSFTKSRTLSFVLKWWWVGFMTNPRILREAYTLWMKKLQLFYRPEVNVGSIGRNETPEEIVLERTFQHYLERLAHTSQHEIIYTPAAGPGRGKKTFIKVQNEAETDPQATTPQRQPAFELEVTTPAFYSELARHRSVLHVFDTHCFNANPEDRMAILKSEDMALVPVLRKAMLEFDETASYRQAMWRPALRSAFNAYLRENVSVFTVVLRTVVWSFGLGLGSTSRRSWVKFRCGERGEQRKQTGDPQPSTLSYIGKDDSEVQGFEMACTTVLLADRLALGSITLLRIYVSALRWLARVLLAWQLSNLTTGLDHFGAIAAISFIMKIAVMWLCGKLSKSP